jgi:hypothetical protein
LEIRGVSKRQKPSFGVPHFDRGPSATSESDSYKFDLRTSLEHDGGSISGTWTEVSRNATGTISGRASGGQIQATVQGPAFSAGVAVAVRGNRQAVTIRSQGTELQQVSIALTR